MAREDILPQLLRQLMQKEDPPEQDDNTILQKMVIPQDTTTLSDSVTVSKFTVSAQKWGGVDGNGNYIKPNWSWGAGQWKG